jgi:hypothetical protein
MRRNRNDQQRKGRLLDEPGFHVSLLFALPESWQGTTRGAVTMVTLPVVSGSQARGTFRRYQPDHRLRSRTPSPRMRRVGRKDRPRSFFFGGRFSPKAEGRSDVDGHYRAGSLRRVRDARAAGNCCPVCRREQGEVQPRLADRSRAPLS